MLYSFGISQPKNNKAAYKVIYRVESIADTTDKQNVHSELKCLFLNKAGSEYFSYDKLLADSVFQQSLENSGSSGGVIDMSAHRSYPVFTIYRTFNENKVTIAEQIYDYYIYDDLTPKISWQLLHQSDTIGGYACQKAIGRFRGRTYIVWFCPELPFNAGPWKLSGLPGLILQAEDTTRSYRFEFVSFQAVWRDYFIKPPVEAVRITKAGYLKLKKAAEDDPDGFLKNSGNSWMKPLGPLAVNGTVPRIKRVPSNNPIELTVD
jgi:GLPGLI family protein